jgi:CrcB protein
VDRSKSLAVALGGASGAGARWLIQTGAGEHSFPWALLVVNVAGAFVLGLVAFRSATGHREMLRLGVGVGFCGGLTTFSAFAVAAADLLRDDRTSTAATFVTVSFVLALTALLGGAALRRHLDPELTP